VEKDERVLPEVFARHGHDVPRTHESRTGLAYRTLPLESALAEPTVGQGETLATVVVLAVVDPKRPAILAADGARSGNPVRHPRDQLGQVKRRIGVVPDTEEEDLPVQFVYPADRAFRSMRREGKWVRSDTCGVGPRGGEGVDLRTPNHTRKPPEGVGHDAEIGSDGGSRGLEWQVVVAAPGRHDECSGGPDGLTQRRDQCPGPSFDRSHGAKGGVDQQHASLLHAQRAELVRQRGAIRL
jgi:hypothetical protein